MSGTAGQKTWALVGKISVIVGILGSLATTYVSIRHPKAKLIASCSYRQYAIPPDLDTALESVRKATSLDSLEAALKQQRGHTDPKCGSEVFDLARAAAKAVEKAWPEEYRYRSDLYNGVWYFEIHNAGDMPAADVVLDVPVKGIALVTPESGARRMVKSDGSLPIGSLRPGNSVGVALWSDIPAWLYRERDFRLTHASGVGSIKHERTLVGWRAWVGENFETLLMMAVVTALAIAIITTAITREGRPRRPTDTGAKEETTKDSGG